MEVINLKTDQLTPYKFNAKKHPKAQVEQIKKSIQEFGFNDPIAVWGEENLIVEGHGRLLAAQELGIEEVPVIRLDNLTDEERKAYTLAHNKLTMNSDFDEEVLAVELSSIQELNMEDFGFIAPAQDEEAQEPEIPKPPKEPQSKVGDMYQLGNHRVICGNSTDEKVIKRLLGGGAQILSSQILRIA